MNRRLRSVALIRPRAALAVLTPAAAGLVLVWRLVDQELNREVLLPTEHFLIVTVVALLTLCVAGLVGLQMEYGSPAFIALGFMTMAGLFAVHALSTPGVLMHGIGGTVPTSSMGDEQPTSAAGSS
jgi:hypothetical protein